MLMLWIVSFKTGILDKTSMKNFELSSLLIQDTFCARNKTFCIWWNICSSFILSQGQKMKCFFKQRHLTELTYYQSLHNIIALHNVDKKIKLRFLTIRCIRVDGALNIQRLVFNLPNHFVTLTDRHERVWMRIYH